MADISRSRIPTSRKDGEKRAPPFSSIHLFFICWACARTEASSSGPYQFRSLERRGLHIPALEMACRYIGQRWHPGFSNLNRSDAQPLGLAAAPPCKGL